MSTNNLSIPTDHEQTLSDLLASVHYRRTAETVAKRERERADAELVAYLEGVGASGAESDELHITASVVTRRTAKVGNETMLAEALNEIGLVIPRKESIDTSELLKIADRYGGDFPGVTINETTSLTVRGMQR